MNLNGRVNNYLFLGKVIRMLICISIDFQMVKNKMEL